jgi:hypothetical protein
LEDVCTGQLGHLAEIEVIQLTLDNILKVLDQASTLEHLVQPWHLDEPADVVRDELVVDDPFRELVPFLQVTNLVS